MRDKILGVLIFVIVILAVSINSLTATKEIDTIIENVENIKVSENGAKSEAENSFSLFNEKEKLLSLTVSHEDLTAIEDCYVELIGYLSVGDDQVAQVTKSRLIHYLEHLRRLCGFNIDSII